MSSSRCPGKVAYDLGGKPSFVQLLERAQQFIPDADYYFVATTVEIVDDPLVLLARAYGYEVFRHSAASTPIRQLALFDHLGLKDEDIYIPVSSDTPFVICDHLPFCKKVVEETGLDTRPVLRNGTLAKAVHASTVCHVGHYRKLVPLGWRTTWKDGATGFNVHPLPQAFVEFPAKYQEPWSWNPLFIDIPLQALQIKGIYELLYKGRPIDIFDLPALFEERPFLAHLVDPDVITNAGGIMPHGAHGYDIQEALNVTDSIIVKWDGKEGLCNLGASDEDQSPEGGTRCESY